MPNYESVFIARQDISASQVEALADGFAKLIEDQGGSITRREHWGLRILAYRIKKNRKGHYVLFNMDAPSAVIHEMERQMRINEDILRYLTLRVEEPEEGPSAMLQSRSGPERGRGDRGRRDDGPRDRGDRGDRPRRNGDDNGASNGLEASSEGDDA